MKTRFSNESPRNTTRPILLLCLLAAMLSSSPICYAQNLSGNNNAFACNLLRAINRQSEGSFVVSPISVTFMLGMLNAGAEGMTRQEITDVIGLDGSVGEINEFCRKMILDASQMDSTVTIKMANCIIANSARGIILKPEYDDEMQHYYMAETNTFNFGNSSALDKVNRWCNITTDGNIPSILDKIDPQEVMYLLNAIYFKANWTEKFNSSSTRPMAFTLPDGSTRELKMMHGFRKAAYCSNNDYQMVYLPYGNQSYGMCILLPVENKTTDDIIENLTAEELERMIQSKRMRQVDILFPRFNTSSPHNLNDLLSAMGMPRAFSERLAEFPNMALNAELYVNRMMQKARIEVNEQGTEASVVTMGAMRKKSVNIITDYVNFHAKRPFVYFIIDSSTHSIFFMGTYRGEE